MNSKLFFLLLFLINKASCQNHFSIEQGLYFKGANYKGQNIGTYTWFGRDSFFLSYSFGDSSVGELGAGKYYIDDSNRLIRNYTEIPALYFNANKINYSAETRESRDSLYFTGQITDEWNNPVKVSSISFPGIELHDINPKIKPRNKNHDVFAGAAADTMGRYYCVLPAKFYPQYARFASAFGCPIDISVLKNFNYHTINVSLNWDCMGIEQPSSPQAFSLIKPKQEVLRIIKIEKDIIHFQWSNLKKITNSKETVLGMLEKAKLKQPNLKQELDWFEEKLRKY